MGQHLTNMGLTSHLYRAKHFAASLEADMNSES